MKRFVGKTIVITGAGQGIGQAIAVRFAQEGAQVALLDTQEPNEAAEFCQKTGASVLSLAVDITQQEQIVNAIHQTAGKWGSIDIWVNNAGIFDDTPLTDLTEARLEEVFAVNYKSMFVCAQLVAPYMMSRQWGRIINIASMAAKISSPNRTAYASSKSAVLGLTRALGVELAPHGITVNAICPGPIDTAMLHQRYQLLAARHDTTEAAWREDVLKSIPAGRFGRPADVAALATFLASDDAEFINAQAITVDGGMVY